MPAAWVVEPSTNVAIAQRCGDDAVVVRWRVGAGAVTWWSSATPLTNLGLHTPANLRLLLASVAPASGENIGKSAGANVGRASTPDASPRPRTILFDESLHGALAAHEADPLQGLPLPLLFAQAALVMGLLLFFFSRRHGPVRSLAFAQGARTSPIEFALSMGALYSRADATSAPVEAAERRLYCVLATAAGLPQGVLRHEAAVGEPTTERPAAVAQALRERFGEQAAWGLLTRDLVRAAAAAEAKPSAREALAVVRALDAHAAALPQQISGYRSGRT